jgi:predicted NAD-dependent protein-ADP-ribosyltransferase YbiA (DUF1768 family)
MKREKIAKSARDDKFHFDFTNKTFELKGETYDLVEDYHQEKKYLSEDHNYSFKRKSDGESSFKYFGTSILIW